MSAILSSNDLSESTTEQLVLDAQQGQTESFGALADRFQRMVYLVCWQRLRNHAEAQEVSQEVLVKAFEKLFQLKEPAAFAGWLRSIAVRQSINRCTRRGPSVAVEPQMLETMCGQDSPPIDNLLANERADQLHAGLSRLARLDRNTLQAFYLQGQSLLEMSDAFAAPVGTIKRRLHVARKRLAKELDFLQAV